MRLIDADALTANVLKWLPPDPCGREEKEFPFAEDICVSTLMEIEEAPTIEPRPKGRWILNRSGAYCCDKCMEPCAGYVMMRPRDRFCKMCGADMRQREEEPG